MYEQKWNQNGNYGAKELAHTRLIKVTSSIIPILALRRFGFSAAEFSCAKGI